MNKRMRDEWGWPWAAQSQRVRARTPSPFVSRVARWLAAVPVFHLLGGCVTGRAEIPLLDPLPVTGPAATVTVWRKNQTCGYVPPNYVLVDDRPVATLAVAEHTSFQVAPGSHTLGVFHPVIDAPLILGSAAAAVPVGVHYGMYGKTIAVDLMAGGDYRYLLQSKCLTLDEHERVMIEPVEKWPEGGGPDAKHSVSPGKRVATRKGVP